MLVLTRREGESIVIGDDITLKILNFSEKHIRIGVNAPRDIKVHREEIYEKIKRDESK